MRMLTYNVGGGRRHASTLGVGLLKRLVEWTAADIVALQEVALTESDRGRLREYLAAADFQTFLSGVTLTSERGDYGNLVFCRGEVTKHHNLVLPSSGKEPRGAIYFSMERRGIHWSIVSTHLGLSSSERLDQLEEIRQFRDEMERELPRDRTVSLLAGDLNVWNRFSRESRFLKEHFGKGSSSASFPTAFPLFALDRVWSRCADAEAVESRRVIRTPELRRHSDHFPLLYHCAEIGN